MEAELELEIERALSFIDMAGDILGHSVHTKNIMALSIGAGMKTDTNNLDTESYDSYLMKESDLIISVPIVYVKCTDNAKLFDLIKKYSNRTISTTTTSSIRIRSYRGTVDGRIFNAHYQRTESQASMSHRGSHIVAQLIDYKSTIEFLSALAQEGFKDHVYPPHINYRGMCTRDDEVNEKLFTHVLGEADLNTATITIGEPNYKATKVMSNHYMMYIDDEVSLDRAKMTLNNMAEKIKSEARVPCMVHCDMGSGVGAINLINSLLKRGTGVPYRMKWGNVNGERVVVGSSILVDIVECQMIFNQIKLMGGNIKNISYYVNTKEWT